MAKYGANYAIHHTHQGLEGMEPGMELMWKACIYIGKHPQDKWNMSAHIIMSMDRVVQCDMQLSVM